METNFDPSRVKTPRRNSRFTEDRSTSESRQMDRLQKAIERNRQKRARQTSDSSKLQANYRESSQAAPKAPTLQERLNMAKRAKMESMQRSTAVNEQSVPSPSWGSEQREEVIDVDKIKIINPTKKSGVSSKINYIKNGIKSASPSRFWPLVPINIKSEKVLKKKSKSYKSFSSLLIKVAWLFCFFLIFRLLTADRGIIDYYSYKSKLNSRYDELRYVKKENSELKSEILKIKTDSAYQKKIVRDYLGFISPNEFLILFAE